MFYSTQKKIPMTQHLVYGKVWIPACKKRKQLTYIHECAGEYYLVYTKRALLCQSEFCLILQIKINMSTIKLS